MKPVAQKTQQRKERKEANLNKQDKQKAYQQKWREANRDKARQSRKRHYQKNRELILEKQRQKTKTEAHRIYMRAYRKNYYQNNKEKFRGYHLKKHSKDKKIYLKENCGAKPEHEFCRICADINTPSCKGWENCEYKGDKNAKTNNHKC